MNEKIALVALPDGKHFIKNKTELTDRRDEAKVFVSASEARRYAMTYLTQTFIVGVFDKAKFEESIAQAVESREEK